MKKEIYYCDRCGKEVDYPLLKPFSLNKEIGKVKLHNYREDKDVDLCQACCDSLKDWFNKPQGEKKDD